MAQRGARRWWTIGLVTVLALAVAGTVVAATFDSGSNPGSTGPQEIRWTGQGVTDGAVDERCGASDTPSGEANEPYLLWILTADGGAATDAVLHLGGSGTGDYAGDPNPGGNEWHLFTPYVAPDAALTATATFDVTSTGSGAWILTISHGCSGLGDPSALTVGKTADGSATTTYTWDLAKTADPTLVHASGGTRVPITFTLTVTHDAGTTEYLVTGSITVTNPNPAAVSGVTITDTIDNGGACTLDGGGTGLTIDPGARTYPYTCTYATAPDTTGVVNTATVTWPDQTVGGAALPAGSAEYRTDPFDLATRSVDECVTVTDAFDGGAPAAVDPGEVCVGRANPATLTFSRTITATSDTCSTYPDTATATTNDTGATVDDSASVELCGNVTGGLTIGYWQNKNGQAAIRGASSSGGVCSITGILRAYAPFQDLNATSSCSQVATYVSNVVKAANASGASMNAMLKAQMLATVLGVWSTPTLADTPVDLTLICRAVGVCGDPDLNPGRYQDTSAAFGNPPAGTCQTVGTLLAYAAGRSDVGGSVWYANVKAIQELAKATFDTIDNNKAWAC